MKTLTLVEGIDVQLHSDSDYQGVLEPNAYVGQRFKLNGKTVIIVSNTMLTWTVRYLTFWEKLNELSKRIRRVFHD